MASILHKRGAGGAPGGKRSRIERHASSHPAIPAAAAGFFMEVIRTLQASGIRFMLVGTFAFSHSSRIPRATADMDIFVDRASVHPILGLFEELGFHTALPFPHWLAKIGGASESIDLIFSSGNAVAIV